MYTLNPHLPLRLQLHMRLPIYLICLTFVHLSCVEAGHNDAFLSGGFTDFGNGESFVPFTVSPLSRWMKLQPVKWGHQSVKPVNIVESRFSLEKLHVEKIAADTISLGNQVMALDIMPVKT